MTIETVQMRLVDNAVKDIRNKLGILMEHKVILFKDALEIDNMINCKKDKWMKNKFTSAQINEFIRGIK